MEIKWITNTETSDILETTNKVISTWRSHYPEFYSTKEFFKREKGRPYFNKKVILFMKELGIKSPGKGFFDRYYDDKRNNVVNPHTVELDKNESLDVAFDDALALVEKYGITKVMDILTRIKRIHACHS